MHEGLKEDYFSTYFAEDLSIYATEVYGPDELALSPAACGSNPRLDRAREAGCSFTAGPKLSSEPPAAGAQKGQGAITVFADDVHDNQGRYWGQPPYHSLFGTLAQVTNNVKRPKNHRNMETLIFDKFSSSCAVGNSDAHTHSPSSKKRCRAVVLGLSRPTSKKQEAHQLKIALAASLRTTEGQSGD
jgi:hypothetical protein